MFHAEVYIFNEMILAELTGRTKSPERASAVLDEPVRTARGDPGIETHAIHMRRVASAATTTGDRQLA